jgi:hypothetical protein
MASVASIINLLRFDKTPSCPQYEITFPCYLALCIGSTAIFWTKKFIPVSFLDKKRQRGPLGLDGTTHWNKARTLDHSETTYGMSHEPKSTYARFGMSGQNFGK